MNIVIGTDLSHGSAAAIRQGMALAQRLGQSARSVQVYVGYVTGGGRLPQLGTPVLDDPDNRRRINQRVQSFVDDQLDGPPASGPDYEIIVEEGRPADQLVAAADRVAADGLVVGQSGRGRLARLIAGSTAQKLAHRPPCPLIIAHPRGVDWAGHPRLAVGVDFSDSSRRAVKFAAALAGRTCASLHIVHVTYPAGPVTQPDGLIDYVGAGEYRDLEGARARAAEQMDALVDQHRHDLADVDWTTEVVAGYPTHELVGYAETHDVDALVLGTVGRSAVDDFLLGSVASGVVKHMPRTMILTPPAPHVQR